MGYTAEHSTGEFEAASAKAKPHGNREAVCVKGEERTKLTLHWLHWLKVNSRLLFHRLQCLRHVAQGLDPAKQQTHMGLISLLSNENSLRSVIPV